LDSLAVRGFNFFNLSVDIFFQPMHNNDIVSSYMRQVAADSIRRWWYAGAGSNSDFYLN